MIRTIDLRNAPPTSRSGAFGDAGTLRAGWKSLDSHAFAFITLVNDETQYATCLRYIDALQIPSDYTVEKIAVFGATSMAEGYQRAMEASAARYKVYVHQDAYLVCRGLLPELLNLFRIYPRLGMVGVLGATRLTASGNWWLNNAFHSDGRNWEYSRPGGVSSWLGPFNRRRLHLNRFRSFVGDYLPAAVVDGLFMATQYDLPWTNPLGGFELYDQVQVLEFIKVGLEVGIARQDAIWCIHWGPLQEFSREQRRRREVSFHYRAAAFRQHFSAFIGVPARRLYAQYRGAPWRSGTVAGEFGDGVTGWRTMPGDLESANPARAGLGVVIAMFNGREVLLRALRALLSQCDVLKGIDYQVVVVDNGSTDGTVEAVRRDFPRVTVLATGPNDGLACGFNVGLRHVGFPAYVLVMHDDVEFSAGTLDRMVSYLREYPSAAGVIAALTSPDGTFQTQRTAIVELMPRLPRRPRPCTFVGTTCALVRGEVFFDVGLYDERFHRNNADLDWSLRARRKGYRFAFLPEVRVVHHCNEGSSRNPRSIVAGCLEDHLWLAYKHAGRRWASTFYWVEWLLGRWLAFRWRRDREALRRLSEGMARMEVRYRLFREENRLPQPL